MGALSSWPQGQTLRLDKFVDRTMYKAIMSSDLARRRPGLVHGNDRRDDLIGESPAQLGGPVGRSWRDSQLGDVGLRQMLRQPTNPLDSPVVVRVTSEYLHCEDTCRPLLQPPWRSRRGCSGTKRHVTVGVLSGVPSFRRRCPARPVVRTAPSSLPPLHVVVGARLRRTLPFR